MKRALAMVVAFVLGVGGLLAFAAPAHAAPTLIASPATIEVGGTTTVSGTEMAPGAYAWVVTPPGGGNIFVTDPDAAIVEGDGILAPTTFGGPGTGLFDTVGEWQIMGYHAGASNSRTVTITVTDASPPALPSGTIDAVTSVACGELEVTITTKNFTGTIPLTMYHPAALQKGPYVLADVTSDPQTQTVTLPVNMDWYLAGNSAVVLVTPGHDPDSDDHTTQDGHDMTGDEGLVPCAAAAVAPGPVTSLAGGAGDGQVVLTWDAPTDDGGSPITDYAVEYSEDGGVTWLTFDDGVSPQTGATVTGLTNGVEYLFQVTARNEAGDSEPAVTSEPITPIAPEPEPEPEPEPTASEPTPSATQATAAKSGNLAATGSTGVGWLPLLALLTLGAGVALTFRRRTTSS